LKTSFTEKKEINKQTKSETRRSENNEILVIYVIISLTIIFG